MATAFEEYFAWQYGKEFAEAERIEGTCDGCDQEAEVVVGLHPTTSGDGECVACLASDKGFQNGQDAMAEKALYGLLLGVFGEDRPGRAEIEAVFQRALDGAEFVWKSEELEACRSGLTERGLTPVERVDLMNRCDALEAEVEPVVKAA